MLTVAAIVDFLERFAPLHLAADWDNVGLLLGDRNARVRRILTCLTVTADVVAEAVEAKTQLIVSHHPILFRGAKRLTASNPEGRMVLALIRGGVAVYSPHTAFDNTRGGINELLAQRLGLIEVAPLRPHEGLRQCKIVVFVPEADLSRVGDALFAAGAGHIGQYSQCSFRLSGTGTFFGSDSTNPTVGRKGRREEVTEWRLEAICPENSVERVLAAMRRAHSYEEPAYDVYPLRPAPATSGDGRVGCLPRPTPLHDFAQAVKTALSAKLVQTVGDAEQALERVAIVCGAGGEMLSDAFRSRADVLLTGELRFHDYLSAQAQGMALCLPGHYATERLGVEELAARMREKWPDLEIWASRQERDPVSCT